MQKDPQNDSASFFLKPFPVLITNHTKAIRTPFQVSAPPSPKAENPFLVSESISAAASQLQTHVDPFEQNSFIWFVQLLQLSLLLQSVPSQPRLARCRGLPGPQAAGAALAAAPSRGPPQHLSGFIFPQLPGKSPAAGRAAAR